MLSEKKIPKRRSWGFSIIPMLALMILTFSTPAKSQVTESFEIEVLAPPVAIDLGGCSEGERPSQVYIGDVLSCTFQAVDNDGDPTEASFTIESSDSTIASVEMVDDSTAEVTFNDTGTVTITITASEVELVIGMLEEPFDSLSMVMNLETQDYSLEVGDTVRFCAYRVHTLFSDGAWRSMPTGRSSPYCPNGAVGSQVNLPIVAFDWSSSDTTVASFVETEGSPASLPQSPRPPADIRLASAP